MLNMMDSWYFDVGNNCKMAVLTFVDKFLGGHIVQTITKMIMIRAAVANCAESTKIRIWLQTVLNHLHVVGMQVHMLLTRLPLLPQHCYAHLWGIEWHFIEFGLKWCVCVCVCARMYVQSTSRE